MEKAIKFKIIKTITLILFLFIFVFNINICLAENLNNAFGDSSPLNKAAGDKGAGYAITGVSVESMISLIITTALAFIGVIFLVLAIYGGYNWMMARGNEDMVKKAKETITNAVIGLIVVLAAYAISWSIIYVIGGKVFK